MTAAMPRITTVIVVSYVLFNLMIAGTLIADPAQLDATYRGGPMTPTREFLWFSIASFHLFVAAVAGTLIPLGLRALKVDPALASSVFITTLTDLFGFLSFLGLATIFVQYLQLP